MADIYQEALRENENGNEISRENIKAAIAKTVELRALHAALMQGNSPANLRLPSVSPVSLSRHTPNLSAQDYPVFTPSYDEDPLPGYQKIMLENQNYAESWGEHTINGGNMDETVLSDYRTTNTSSRKGLSFPPEFEGHICPAEDQTPTVNALKSSSPPYSYTKSRRNSMGDIKSVSSCNKCKPAIISSESSEGLTKNGRKSNIIVPLTDSHSSLHSQTKNRGLGFSWLFPNKLKKKNKNENFSPVRAQSDEASQFVEPDESLKKELMQANESRDAALNEVSEMKSSFGEMNNKLEYLETYCEELKKALKQAVQVKLTNIPKMVENSNSTPVSEEVMVEGFLQAVSESRLSVRQFCKSLVSQIDETDLNLVENLNSLLQPYKLSLNSKYSKAVLYHLEAIINQSLYQDFENTVFRKSGAPKILDPRHDRQARFQSFVSLRNLSWNEVLRKGTKYYSEDFSKFCDQKMSGIIGTLGWTRPWAEKLLQAFFVAAKCVWLLHLLAFSFEKPLGILRVDENVSFEGNYMEDIFGDGKRLESGGRVKVMVMPGFYVLDRVLRCKVICRYKSVN